MPHQCVLSVRNESNQLLQCIECGCSTVSPRAQYCPSCHSAEWRGTSCVKCGKLMSSRDRAGKYAFHPECARQVMQLPTQVTCSECGLITKIDLNFLARDWYGQFEEAAKNYPRPCGRCGHPELLVGSDHACGICTLPVFGKASVQIPDLDYPEDSFRAKTLWFHECCRATAMRHLDATNAEIRKRRSEARWKSFVEIIGPLLGVIGFYVVLPLLVLLWLIRALN